MCLSKEKCCWLDILSNAPLCFYKPISQTQHDDSPISMWQTRFNLLPNLRSQFWLGKRSKNKSHVHLFCLYFAIHKYLKHLKMAVMCKVPALHWPYPPTHNVRSVGSQPKAGLLRRVLTQSGHRTTHTEASASGKESRLQLTQSCLTIANNTKHGRVAMEICYGRWRSFSLSSSRGDIAGFASCREEASSSGKTHQVISHHVIFH